ncbi:MAG: hypothetical protein AAFQ42_14955 [Pseudomonadota bacterium]
MTKFAAIAAVAIALSGVVVSTSASAAPSYGLQISSGETNPFKAVDGR